MRARRTTLPVAATAVLALSAGLLTVTPAAAAEDARAGGPPTDAIDLDVLFVGAHPDDEAGSLSTFGQWNESAGLTAGVITVTRGEGGGNAVGLEEGPELGILREAEERRAVANAGIEHVYNLDKIDFYYTASAPLSEQAWDGDDALERVVRVIRATRPEVIVTMNPSPTGGNHGNHQQAARLAVEGYLAAADPAAFPEQLDDEGLATWRAGRILQSGAAGTGVTGSACETMPYQPADPTDTVFGVWAGRTSSATGETWALRERQGQWEYVSQGWAGFPPPPDDPEQIGCDWYTLIDSRTPYPEPAGSGTTALEGAALPAYGGLPVGTELEVTPHQFLVRPGEPFDATVTLRAPARKPLVRPTLEVTAPAGWTIDQADTLPRLVRPGRSAEVDVVVTPPADAALGERVAVGATVSVRGASGSNTAAVETTPAVHARLAPRREATVFADWTAEQGLPKLESLIAPIASVGTGRTQPVTVDVVNDGDADASGTVALTLADGFTAEPATQAFDALAPGETTSVTFDVTNTDPSLPTANRAPDGGYPFEIVTTFAEGTDEGTDSSPGILELVPTTVIPEVTAPVIDGAVGPDEYPGDPIDTSTRWEGEEAAPEDASGTTHVSFTADALYVAVEVTDDALGTVLTPEDCKRHWRTDSVEITIDPRGTSSNSSTTFKTGIFPVTDDPAAGDPPCFQRDADNNQGPGDETAPGMEVASVVGDTGYTIEAKIPFDVLPDTVDPQRMGMNVLIYDSDTQDKTGQTRLGWSTFGGVQADPFRWALATLPGLPAAEPAPVEPTLPDTAALSVESPQSIAQSAADGVGLGGGPKLPDGSLRVVSATTHGDEVRLRLAARTSGAAHVYVYVRDAAGAVVGQEVVDVRRGLTTVPVPVSGPAAVAGDLEALVAFAAGDATLAVARDVR